MRVNPDSRGRRGLKARPDCPGLSRATTKATSKDTWIRVANRGTALDNHRQGFRFGQHHVRVVRIG